MEVTFKSTLKYWKQYIWYTTLKLSIFIIHVKTFKHAYMLKYFDIGEALHTSSRWKSHQFIVVDGNKGKRIIKFHVMMIAVQIAVAMDGSWASNNFITENIKLPLWSTAS